MQFLHMKICFSYCRSKILVFWAQKWSSRCIFKKIGKTSTTNTVFISWFVVLLSMVYMGLLYCAEMSLPEASAMCHYEGLWYVVVLLVKWCVLMRTFKVHKTLRVFIVSVVMSRLMYVKRVKKSKIWVKTWKNEVFVYMSLLTACTITKQKNLKKWIFLISGVKGLSITSV